MDGAICSRDWIRERYREVQALAQATLELTRRAVAGHEDATRDVPEALRRFAAAYEEQVRFEAEVMLPRLRAVAPWGPARAAALLAQHLRVREPLEELLGAANEGGEDAIADASDAIEELVAAVEENTRDLLLPEITNDEPLVTDQITD